MTRLRPSDLTRRAMLGTAVLAGTAAALPLPPARAAAPAVNAQAPGFYRYKVGDIVITVVTDGMARVPLPDTLVRNADKAAVSAALADAHLDPTQMLTPYSPIVVSNGGKLYVIDTGTGEANFIASKGAAGQFQRNFAAAGFDPKDVDAVIISHYHGDHVNGLLKADNSLAFPNAEVLVPAAEHGFWMDDGEMSRAPKGRMEGLFKNNRRVFSGELLKRVRPYEGGRDVVPGISAVSTFGHSAGHTSHIVSSGAQQVFVQADVTHVPFLFVRNPGWHAQVDQDGAMAEQTRRKVYDMLTADRMMLQAFHHPFPGVSHVEKDGAGYRVVPVVWNPVL